MCCAVIRRETARRTERLLGWSVRRATPGRAVYDSMGFARFTMRYRVIIEQDEDGFFVAECPSLPGCVRQGSTRQEALDNIKEAISGYLESLKKHNEPIPPPIWEDTVDINL
jgi:antitoxin HicB